MKNLSLENETLQTRNHFQLKETFSGLLLPSITRSGMRAQNEPTVVPLTYRCLLKIAFVIGITCGSASSLAMEKVLTTENKSEMFSKSKSRDKGQQILQRIQLGEYPNRLEAMSMVKRLDQLGFETFIIKEKKGFWVSVGAFSSKANLERELKRLEDAGFSANVNVVKIEADVKRTQDDESEKKKKARSTVFSAKVPKTAKIAESQFVPRQDYEKLKREVEILKAQMQALVIKEHSKEQATESVATATQEPKTKTKSETLEKKNDQQPKTKSKPSETVDRESDQQAKDKSQVEEKPEKKNELSVAEGSREKEAEVSKRELDTFLRGQKVLFKRGELQLEYNLAYTRDTAVNSLGVNPENNQVTSTPKLISTSVNTALLFRYGLADDLELDLTIPFGYAAQKQDARPFEFVDGKQINRSANVGIGDVNGGLRYMAWHESGNIPSITLNVNAKSKTGKMATFSGSTVSQSNGLGSGFWQIGGGISLTKTIDPVVFFGSLGYTATLQEGGVDPGDQVSYSFGSGFSMNDRVSMSMALSGAVAQRSKINGEEVAGSSININTLQITSTIKLSRGLFVEPFVSFGLNKEANDFVVGFNVPFRFDRRFPLPFVHD